MRYSKAAASLLSTAFAFQAKSVVVVADIFDPIDHQVDAGAADEHSHLAERAANKLAADTGVLAAAAHAATPMIALASNPSTCAPANIVDCVGGNLATDSATSCSVACAGACCDYNGADACTGFTGKVCKDDKSCMGYKACDYATIPLVVYSCYGNNACYQAGSNGGSIGKIVDSCIGDFVCVNLGRNYGKVGNILNSCLGISTCGEMARSGGTVGDLSDACSYTAACQDGAKFGGSIASIINSCTAYFSCYGLGYGAGKVGNVKDSCNRRDSCKKISFKRGSIGDISASCNAIDACLQAGSTLNGAITSNLNMCCNTENACKQATQATLPAQCKNSKVRRCAMMQFASSKHRQNHSIDLISLSSMFSHQPLCATGASLLDIISGSKEARSKLVKPQAKHDNKKKSITAEGFYVRIKEDGGG